MGGHTPQPFPKSGPLMGQEHPMLVQCFGKAELDRQVNSCRLQSDYCWADLRFSSRAP